jgi:hypothetical protein
MRSLPPELPDSTGGSGFDGFLSRLRPYPSPPDFRIALSYAAAGSALTLLAAGATALLPSGASVEGDGFYAIGATSLASVLDMFGVMALPLAVLGVAGLVATAIVAVVDRPTPRAGNVLVAPTVFGVAAALFAGIGWLVFVAATLLNLLSWIAAILAIIAAFVLLVRGQLVIAAVVGVLGLAVFSALENAASGPVAGGAGEPSVGRSVEPTPPAAEPRQERWQIKRERREQRLAERRRRLARKRRMLGRRRAALERRMDAEYAAWQQVPYVAPCDESDRRVELESLREEFAEMAGALRTAQRNGGHGQFHQVRKELDRMGRERGRALADPYGFYDRYGRCPSGPAAMAFLW